MEIREFGPDDVGWAEAWLDRNFGGRMQARMGRLVDALGCAGFVAVSGAGAPAGLLTYHEDGDEAEVALLFSLEDGAGTVLLETFRQRVAPGKRRCWLVTTNDNTNALRFYQRRGWVLAQLRRGAVNDARLRLKPSIPREVDGIPVRDEIVLELEQAPESGV